MTKIFAPLQGWVSSLDEVPDEVFSGRILGDGVAIDPTGSTVVSPCDGIVATPAKHAVMVRADCGAEVLIHVGLETVALGGRGFTARVKEGQRVKAGDPLLDFDLGFLASRVKSLISPVVVANGDSFRILRRAVGRETKPGEMLLELETISAVHATTEGSTVTRDVVIAAAHGLHARPAALLAAAAKAFQSEIVASLGERKANARSAMALMALTARAGDRLTLTATGPDAQTAVDALVRRIAALTDEPPPAVTLAAPNSADTDSVLHGIGAAPGSALGPLVRLHAADLVVAEQGRGLAHETAELRRAIAVVKARLDQAGVHRGIANAHIALLEDEELHQAALHDIEQGKSAGFAWRRAVRAYADILRAAGDERLRERAGDLRDLERQVLAALAGETPKPQWPQGAILAAEEILPSDLMGVSGLAGIVSVRGGPTSHVAILATGIGIPALLGVSEAVLGAEEGREVLLDADNGLLDLAPDEAARQRARDTIARTHRIRGEAQAKAMELCRTADGVRVEVFANLGKGAQEAADAVRQGAEGCGLLRTEFLFMDRDAPPTEDEQHTQYQAIAGALNGRDLILRTFDIGADKPASYLAFPHEDNPALGIRGIRTALLWPDLLRAQLRAAARVEGVKIMLPMVIAADEIAAVRQLLVDICAGLGRPCPPLGIMIETPASAVLAEQLVRHADFLSIGTNDLSQYVLAIDRGHRNLGSRLDALHPAVLRLIARTAEAANAAGKPVGVCGGLAADPVAAALLVGLGIGELSVPAASIPQLKATIRALRRDVCRALAEEALTLDSAAAVRALVRTRLS